MTDVGLDGRTARRDRNRELVLDAVIELFTENPLEPNASEVANRSGVSLRSVYRYFEDRDDLVRAAIARHAERLAPLFELPGLGEGALDARITRFVQQRLRLYEGAASTARAALLRAPGNHLLREQMDRTRELLRRQMHDMFAPELMARRAAPRRATAAAIDTMFQFEAVEHLRHRLRYSPAQTSDVLRRTLTALLDA